MGVIDLTPFTKHEVTGPGAEAWLDGLVANKVPSKIGRMALSHALTRRGGIRSEFTITKIAEEHFYVVSAGAAERYDSDYLVSMLPKDGVTLRNITASRGCFVVAGPRSRDVLSKLVDAPLDNAAFPGSPARWPRSVSRPMSICCASTLSGRSAGSCTSRSSTPIICSTRSSRSGAEHHISMVGMRAMESLRLEKSYRMWGTDLTPDYTPYEAGLDRFVRLNKGPFVGKEALQQQLGEGVPNRFVTFEVHGVKDADPLGNEPLFDAKGRLVGRATAGYYGHALRKSLGLGYIKPEFASVGTEFQIEILGERKAATVLIDSPYDPENKELRA